MKKKLILFGAGYQGRRAIQELRPDYEIKGVIDNHPQKNGTFLEEIPVFSAESLKRLYDDHTDVVIAAYEFQKIAKQLEEMGICQYYMMQDGQLYDSKDQKAPHIQRCSRCVMDNSSDDTILFDAKGYCNYCNRAFQNMGKIYFPNREGEKRLRELLNKVKQAGSNKQYDCIMGISGGLDSSYLLYLGHKWRLRVLAIHIDDGYDTDISKENLERLISTTGFDYEVIVPDKDQFNDLTLSYMKAGVPNIAVPQDNVLFAFLYRKMKEYHIHYFLSGGNFALECILQKGNTHDAYDLDNLLSIHKQFGRLPINKLELISRKQMLEDKQIWGIETLRPLNYINYNREKALHELKEFCGFRYYGSKHLENILTAFIQMYWLPQKFGVDKRTSHLSSMIVSGQMTRREALRRLAEPICDERIIARYEAIMKEKLNLDDREFDTIMNAPVSQHEEYML